MRVQPQGPSHTMPQTMRDMPEHGKTVRPAPHFQRDKAHAEKTRKTSLTKQREAVDKPRKKE